MLDIPVYYEIVLESPIIYPLGRDGELEHEFAVHRIAYLEQGMHIYPIERWLAVLEWEEEYIIVIDEPNLVEIGIVHLRVFQSSLWQCVWGCSRIDCEFLQYGYRFQVAVHEFWQWIAAAVIDEAKLAQVTYQRD